MANDDFTNEDEQNDSEDDEKKRTLYDAVFGKEEGSEKTKVVSVDSAQVDPKAISGQALIDACLTRLGMPPISLKKPKSKTDKKKPGQQR